MTIVESRSQLRAAVVGFGSIGRRHFENLATLGVKDRIVVRRKDNANPAFTPPPGTPIVHSHQEAIAAGIDLAIICNPSRLHVETAREYLSAGVAVLVEKPLCAIGDEQAVAELVEMARRPGSPAAGMAYCMRYHPAYRAAHEAVTGGRLGRVLYAKAWFENYLPDWHPWEDYRQSYAARADLGGGVLPTMDHEIDFLNWCLGEPKDTIGRATNTGSLDVDVPDQATLLIDYARGVTATVVLSLCRRDRCRGFEFVGDEATLRFAMERSELQLVAPGEPPVTLWHDSQYPINQMYLDMLEGFLMSSPVSLQAGLWSAATCRRFQGV